MKSSIVKYAKLVPRTPFMMRRSLETPLSRGYLFQTQFRMMSSKIVDSSTYIKDMQDPKDWQTAMENETRPVLIQAGASWCGPCQVLKP
jgi:thiol-disulfide isomerase/thioredoxin